MFTSQHVVPYNPHVSRTVECCLSIGSVRYLFKYIHKGHDRATFAITTAVLVTIALLATLLPALRAAHADPLLAIRSD